MNNPLTEYSSQHTIFMQKIEYNVKLFLFSLLTVILIYAGSFCIVYLLFSIYLSYDNTEHNVSTMKITHVTSKAW